MGIENLIYVSMTNFGEVTAIQPGQMHIGHTEVIAYTHDNLIQIRENCKHDNRYKILGADTCKHVMRLRLNRSIARGSRLNIINAKDNKC